MNITRAVVLGVAGGSLAAWFAAASTSGPRVAPIPSASRSAAADTTGAALAAEIARLHDRLHPTVAPDQPARNLFEYGARETRIESAPAPAAPVIQPADVPAAAPSAPPLTLIGIAEDDGVRSAIVSGAGQLSIVKEGERIADRYTVVRVGAASVDLEDATLPADAAAVRLVLK